MLENASNQKCAECENKCGDMDERKKYAEVGSGGDKGEQVVGRCAGSLPFSSNLSAIADPMTPVPTQPIVGFSPSFW